MNYKNCFSLLLPLILPLYATQAQSVWNDSTGNHLWNDAANWSPGIPNNSTVASFSGVGGSVILDSNLSSAFSALEVVGSNGAHTLTSDNSTVRTLSGGALRVGYGTDSVASFGNSLTIDKVQLSTVAGSSLGYRGYNNELIVTGGGKFVGAYTAGFSIGAGTGTAANNSNNSILVKNGGEFSIGFVTVGGTGAGNSITVTGAGSSLKLTGLTGQTNFNLNIGNINAAATNSVSILDGATATISAWNTRIVGGSLTIGRGSSLTHNHPTATQSVLIGSRGALYGAGTLVADEIRYNDFGGIVGTGAQVYVGESASDFATFNVTGNWLNKDMKLNLEIGDLTGLPIAGTNYDLLSLSGQFTFGGELIIDLSQAVLPDDFNIKLIGWTSTQGLSTDMVVNFINGSALNYSIAGDGLYISAIPEPGSMALLLAGIGGVLVVRWKRKMQGSKP